MYHLYSFFRINNEFIIALLLQLQYVVFSTRRKSDKLIYHDNSDLFEGSQHVKINNGMACVVDMKNHRVFERN